MGQKPSISPYSILALGMKELEFRDDSHPSSNGLVIAVYHWSASSEQKQYFTSSKKRVLVARHSFKMGKEPRMVSWQSFELEHPDPICVTLEAICGLEHPPRMLSKNLLIFDYTPLIQMFWIKMDFAIHRHAGAGILMGCIEEGIPKPDFAL